MWLAAQDWLMWELFIGLLISPMNKQLTATSSPSQLAQSLWSISNSPPHYHLVNLLSHCHVSIQCNFPHYQCTVIYHVILPCHHCTVSGYVAALHNNFYCFTKMLYYETIVKFHIGQLI